MPRTRLEVRASESHVFAGSHRPHDTPKKARTSQAVADLERFGPSPAARSKAYIFERFKVSKPSGYRILADVSDRRATNQIGRDLTIGRPSKITPAQIEACERLITSYGLHGRSMN